MSGGAVRNVVVVSGGTSEPSSTRMLADRIVARVVDVATSEGVATTVRVVDLRPLAADIATAQVTGFAPPAVADALTRVAAADALVLATPVYTAGISGLVKSFLDLLDTDAIVATPVLLAATAGTPRHALVLDSQLRPLAAYLRALPAPTGIFAASDDWADPALGERIERAAAELVVLIAAGVRERMREASWRRYSHGGTATAVDDEPIELDTDLMRLATGGR